jgi:RNA polymerase sigma factor (sigma-70 family)
MRQPPSTEASDCTLAEALRHGDHGAFTIVMTRHGRAVFRYAWRLADEPNHVDDITQETFLVLWKRRRQVTVAGDSLLPWLLATCKFVSFNANRKSRSRRTEQLPDAESAQLPVTGREELVWITGEIARLGPIDQRLCQLCLIDGISYADAAVVLGLTPAAARKRMQRTRSRLAAVRDEIQTN